MRSSLGLTLVLAGTLGLLGCGDGDPTGPAGGGAVSTIGAHLTSTISSTGGTGLMAAYGFSEASGNTLLDASGNGRTGTLVNGPAWTAGRFGSSLSFDGSDDYVAVEDFAPPPSVTLEAWVYPGPGGAKDIMIIEKNNAEYDLRIDVNGNLFGAAGNGTGNSLVDRSFNFYAPGNANHWYHVAYTFDSTTDEHRLYRNGNLVASGTNTTTISDTGTPLWIGRHSQFNFGSFLGRIDEVRIYDRALSQSELQADMNTPVTTTTLPPPPEPPPPPPPPPASPPQLASGPLTRYSGNPLLRNGPATYDYWKAGPRVVLKEGANTYRMWYEAVGSGTPSITSIAYATSPDGLNWTKQGPQLFPTLSWEGNEVSPQSMLVEDGVYKLWYHAGGFLNDGVRSGGARIGYASSRDGLNWTKYPTPVLTEGPAGSYDDEGVAEPRVIKVGSEYRMYYTAVNRATGNKTLALATSNDGVNWVKYASNPVIRQPEWGDAWGGAIFFENGVWQLWHGKADGIHYKSSNDGIAWTDGPNNPVLRPDSDPTSPTFFIGDSVSGYRDGNTYRIMFTGFSWNLFGSQGRFEGINLATITVDPATPPPPPPSHP